jgi:predicted phosphohydrolase
MMAVFQFIFIFSVFMNLQYASDLHLEFPQNREFLKKNPLRPLADLLLLAGDIVPFYIMDRHADFFDYVSEHFKTVYWLPGNHEYYYADATIRSGELYETIRNNVFLVNNMTMVHDHTRLIFSTLWSAIAPGNAWDIERGMSDFQVIRYKGQRFSVPDYNQLHDQSLSFLRRELEAARSGKTVVVTHHVPTFLHYPEKYKGDVLSEAFAVELFPLIEATGPDYWIYGHHHNNTPGFRIGKTAMLTNQLGYVKYDEHELFDPGKLMIDE